MNLFLQRFGSFVTGVLHGFDRLVFRGTLRSLMYGPRMMAYLSRVRVLMKDFGNWSKERSERIKELAAQTAAAAGRPQYYLDSGAISKEDLVRDIVKRDRLKEGLVAVVSCVEPCQAFEVHCDRTAKYIEIRSRQRKCLHLYYYWLHCRFGLMHVRVQTWAPYTLRVCLNGREWLARQMDAAGIAYERSDNCFRWIEDVAAAQKLLDQQGTVNWSEVLEELAKQFNPIYQPDFADLGLHYYWSTYQSEWASDVLFRSAEDLSELYPRLIHHGMRTFASGDVMRFLGRKVCLDGRVNPRFRGEVITDLKERPEGVRIKHRVGANSIKLYDKSGSVLRVETTVNDPRDFKVYRRKQGESDSKPAWLPLRKHVADLPRRVEVSQKANERYLEALAAIEDPTPLRQLLDPLCQPKKWKGQRVRALNPLAADDAALLAAVVRGEFLLNGFRNRDLAALLFTQPPRSPEERRRRSAAVTRKLRLLRAHGLIHKVPHTHRYLVSDTGKTTITALLAARETNAENLTKQSA
jgi:hypothetical protein